MVRISYANLEGQIGADLPGFKWLFGSATWLTTAIYGVLFSFFVGGGFCAFLFFLGRQELNRRQQQSNTKKKGMD